MKIRRLDREYQEVMKAEITTDPNDFKGLSAVLQADREAAGEEENNNDGGDDDGFGDFQEADADD